MLISAKPRNLEASFRDLGSERADVRKSAVLDVVRHASEDKALRDRALAGGSRANQKYCRRKRHQRPRMNMRSRSAIDR